MARILLVDGEELVRMTVRQMLENNGHEVTEAADGNKALAALRRAPVDLVITDILMPNKEGLETIAELRQLYPAVKIIAMSGGGRMGNTKFLLLAERLGAEVILTKPFKSKELIDAIKACFAPGDENCQAS